MRWANGSAYGRHVMSVSPPEPQDRHDAAYRPCVGIALFNRNGLVFLGRRQGIGDSMAQAHAWQMPQGGIDEGEAPHDAALRELYEETNVAAGSVILLGQTEGWLTYDLPPELLKRSWQGRYRGQAQKWFAFGFTGSDDEIDIDHPAGGAHKPEFDAWRWERLAATASLIIPFKRSVYEIVVAEFAGHETWRAGA
ncbi:RNA pyrophosphohydrolase [Methylobacterium gnaphalii]|uniref:RNA pyrophosphohydrolase n=2 Tax=Methylobacterium gnaphalii TaxID=1010610 RepID=A0A512JQ73_9HYPH|nr:RNA pyrophosphohydrolase [Methylobacterium gnaphalii]GJD71009.1 RNA pyrophosphohydrolase [Methylobacterium gnaphalii]GLS48216.1 RNA pyrophosphohydrolase [Methylobacterium gnaphalii]